MGVLIWAKRAGIVASLREELDSLETKGRFRLSREVYEDALQAVGESGQGRKIL